MKKIPIENIWVLVRHKRWVLVFLYLLLLFSTLLESFGIAAFYPVVDMMQDSARVENYRATLLEYIPWGEDYFNSQNFVPALLISIGGLFVFKNVFLVLAGYGNNKVTQDLYCDWVDQIFKNYLNKSFDFFSNHQAGDLIQRQLSQTENATSAVRTFITLLGNVTSILAMCLVMWTVAAEATLILFAVLALVYFATKALSEKKLYETGNKIVELQKLGYGLSTEVLSGIRQVRAFNVEDFFILKFQRIWKEFAWCRIQNAFLTSLPKPVLETLVVLIVLAAIYVLLGDSERSAGIMPALAVFAAALFRILPLASAASANALGLAALLPSVNTVAALLVVDEEKVKDRELPPFSREIYLDRVSFSYANREKALDEVSLIIHPNKFYGIVGESGSGKSTLIDLLLGFITPQEGEVRIDGVDMKMVNPDTWLRQLGIISQETYIFSGTIAENICFGLDKERWDRGRLLEACRVACILDFIEGLTEGFDTKIGERGVNLSGGQRQRLALARSFYLNPSILIFDEATSALDPISEKKVQNAIDSLHGNKTVIAVAHRLTTVKYADHIFVFEKGKLVGQGAHDVLLRENSVYQRLCQDNTLH